MIVLLNCSGICVEMTRAFQDAGAFVIATDANPYSPSLLAADLGLVIPPVGGAAYLESIREIVSQLNVDLIVSMTDEGTIELARAELETLVLLSPAPLLELLWDKWETHWLLQVHGFQSPVTRLFDENFDFEQQRFPAMVKPRTGANGRGIYEVAHRDDFRGVKWGDMVQEKCLGEEWSIDVFGDLQGRCINAIPRRMIRVRGGETIVGEVAHDWALINLGVRVCERFGIVGPAMIQGFKEQEGFLITDINPRFGGGSNPAILASGGNYHELALALARGETLEPRIGGFRDITYTRFWTEFLISRN